MDGSGYPSYDGLSAVAVGLCFECGIEDRQFKGSGKLIEQYSSEELNDHIRRLAWELGFRPDDHEYAMRHICWLTALSKEAKRRERLVVERALQMAAEKPERVIRNIPIQLVAQVMLQDAEKELDKEDPPPRLMSAELHINADPHDMFILCRDLIERGYLLAAYDILYNTTQEKRKKLVEQLVEAGMTEEDLVIQEGEDFSCVICKKKAVPDGDPARRRHHLWTIRHSDYCLPVNFSIGDSSLHLTCGCKRGLAKVPIVTDARCRREQEGAKALL